MNTNYNKKDSWFDLSIKPKMNVHTHTHIHTQVVVPLSQCPPNHP